MIQIRAIENKDIEQLRLWRNKWFSFFRQYYPISSVKQIHWYNTTKDIMFSIVENDKLIGCCGLCYIDLKNRNADLSLYIGETYIDERALEVLKCLFAYAFNELGLERIYNDLLEYDMKKLNILMGAGMKVEGRARNKYYRNGQFYDAVLLSILRKDFIGVKNEI